MTDAFAGFRRTDVAGIPVLWLPDTRFKTFRVTLSARRPLGETAAARSILPGLLMQGTVNYPNRPALARRMESLYGAAVAPGTGKVGETHTLRFSVDCVAEEFLPGRPDQLADSLDFLTEYLAHPKLEGDGFPADTFERERRQAANDARAVFDDRGSYAAERALALACDGEPMAIPEHGGVAAIEAMDRTAPEQARQDFLSRGKLLVVGMGALPEDGVFLDRIGTFLGNLPAREPGDLPVVQTQEVVSRRASVERVDLQQSKMVLTFRVPMTDDSPTWMARALFASMLGGGPHSRLFREVREKRSLAYYAQAALDRHKGLLVVHIGLDEVAAKAVEDETLRQIDELAAGRFTAEELDTARAGILSTITALQDGIRSQMRFVEDQWTLGLDRTPQDLLDGYLAVTADQVAASTAGLKLDYSYLLAPMNGAATTADPNNAEVSA